MVKTRVIFKKESDGTIIAFLPEMEVNSGRIGCFTKNEGHGEADLLYFWKQGNASPEEYEETKNIMESVYGYDLKVMKRLNRKWMYGRKEQ